MVALREPAPPRHVVQFYENERQLIDRVAPFLADALERGEAILVIARATLCEKLAARLPAGEPDQHIFLDARQTLDAICVDGVPQEDRFREVIAARVGFATERFAGMRAYGEMVDLLAEEGRY